MARQAMLGLLVATAVLLGLGSRASALSDYLTAFTRLYSPKTETTLAKARCVLCHASPEGGKRNLYSDDFAKQRTRDAAAFKAVESLDSDRDGANNLDEIKAGTLPGDPTSKPRAAAATAPAAAAPPSPRPTPAATPSPGRTPPPPTTARYVGAEACRMCHADQHRQWTRTAHARAFELLEISGQPQNPECLGCHSTGYRRGGFTDATATPGLKGVQCEACHGPGSEHQGDPRRIIKTPPSSVCAACHKQFNIH